MSKAAISIPVDAETARAFHTASPGYPKKIQVLLQLRLRELAELPTRSLIEIMDDIGAKAKARGLTPEILGALLHDELVLQTLHQTPDSAAVLAGRGRRRRW